MRDCEPLSDEDVAAMSARADRFATWAEELLARRAAMAHADSLGMDVARIARLICPPPCETCGGSGVVPAEYGERTGVMTCPDCHGRPKQTLHDRLEEAIRMWHDEDSVSCFSVLTAILADVAEVTP